MVKRSGNRGIIGFIIGAIFTIFAIMNFVRAFKRLMRTTRGLRGKQRT